MSGCDVAIVGGGPVGQTLALLLGRRGRLVELFEARSTPFPLPRAVHLDHQAARVLQAVGVMDDLEPATEPMDAYEWRSAAGVTLLRLEAGERGCSGWPASAMFHQPDLERVLRRRISERPEITVHRGWEVTALECGDDQVQVHASGPLGRRSETTASWVVGCDGAHSTTRRLLDVTVDDHGPFYDWLVVDVTPEQSERWSPLNIQICDPRRPTTAVSGGRGRRRWEFMRLPGESPEELSRPETAWRLLASWGVTPANARLERSALYRFGARSAQRWRQGRVLLAGDAAHQMPPFAGQGLCSGLRDAANLAWKLDAVARGDGPSSLLDSYQGERGPQVAVEIDFSMALGKIICVADPAAAAARDEDMAAAARLSGPIPLPPPPPLGPGIVRCGDPHGGVPSFQGTVAVNGRHGRFDDIMHAAGRWVLLSPHGDPAAGLGPGARRWLHETGAVVSQVAQGGPVLDVDGTYGQWFADLGAAGALIRPDFLVFGTVGGTGGAAGFDVLVEQARAALCGAPGG